MVEEGAMSLTFDELSMQQTLLFSDTLKDLRTLRSQLYSAAEYFELAYTKNDQKQIVVNSLKDYTVKALVNTVDHLGSTSFKVSSLVDQKFNEVADTNLRLSCIEQRTGVCQAYMDREGLAQQSLVITAPKYHKRYVLPGESIPDAVRHAVPNYRDRETTRIKNKSAEMHQLQNAVRQKTKEKQHPSFRKLRSIAHAPSQRARSSSPAQKVRPPSPSQTGKPLAGDKNSGSPISLTNPLTRSGSLSRKPSLLKSASVRMQSPSVGSMQLHAERNDDKEGEQNPKKGRKFLKSLLSRRKSRKDESLDSYLDEY